MKKTLLFALFVAVLSIPAQAQTRWGVRAGISDSDPMIGAELLFPVAGHFVVNPNVEVTGDLLTINGDVHYDFGLSPTSDFWLGAGLAFLDPDNTDSEFGVNLLGGIGARRGSFYPYAQLKLTSGGDVDNFATLALGVRF